MKKQRRYLIFSVFSAAPPEPAPGESAVAMAWAYISELIFHMMILVGADKMADRLVREIVGQ